MMGVKSGISSFLRRRRLVNATLALAVKPVVEALEPRQLLSASGDNISLDQLRYQWTHMPAVARHTLAVAEYVYPEFTAKLNVELDRLGLPRVEPEAGQLSTASNIGKAKTRHIRHHKPPQRHHKPKLHNLGRTPPAAPTVSGTPTFTYDPALPQQISVTFSENVSATTWANTLTLVNPNSSTSKFVSPTSASYNSTSHVATYSFSSTASLEDGNFAGVVHGWMISSVATGLPLVGSDGAAGDDFVTTGGGSFYFYDTDLTGNRATDIFDLNALLANFNTTGKAYSQGNASYDAAGNVDIFDLNLLLPKFNTSLANLGPASALTATSNSSGVQLSWTASTDTNVTSYDIFRDDVSGGLQLTGSITGTSYSDTSVSPGTYSYFVVARSSAGGTSFPTNLASTTFLSPTAASIAPDLSGIDGAPGGTAMGADGGDPASLGFSGAVHYSDGTVSVSSNDLDPAESGLISGHTRTWTDQAGVWVASNGLNGNNEVVSQWPVLQQESSGAVLSVSGGQTTRWFDSNGSGGFNERFYGQDSLSSDGSGGYNLVDSAGNKFNYFGLSGSLVLERGQLQSLTDPNGDITSFTYNSTTGTLTTVQRKRLSDSVVLEQLNYTYNSAGKVAAVEMDRLIGSTLTAVRTASYEYYDGSTPFGQAGALARVTITQGTSSGTVVNHELYRYDPSSGLLTYVVEGGSYEKFAADAGVSNPLTASNTIVSQYADEAFTYFGPADGTKNGKVKTQSLNGGTYTYQYDYLADTAATAINTWRYKTLETLPDGNTNTVYTNYAGEVLLRVFTDTVSTSQKWATAYQYDSQGRVLIAAEPSATTTTHASGDLAVVTDSSVTWYMGLSGLEHVTDYYGSTTGNDTLSGGASGYEDNTYLRNGYSSSSNGDVQSTSGYYAHPGSNGTIYPVALSTVYRGSAGAGSEPTSYVYSWVTHASVTDQPLSETVTYPIVTTAENGPGGTSADTKQMFFDPFGRVAWTKDGSGYINYTAYDDATGAVTKTIDDVDTTKTLTFTSLPGWMTPAASGLLPAGGQHLTTTMTVDGLGRTTQVTSPNGNATTTQYIDTAAVDEVITTPPTVSTGVQPPIQVTRDNRASGDLYSFTAQSGTGTLSIRSLSQSHYGASGQLAWSERYPDTTGMTYVPPPNSTTPGTFSQGTTQGIATLYGYDLMGRQNSVATDVGLSGNPSSTTSPTLAIKQITHTIFDSLGRVASIWTGTDDSGFTNTSHGSNTNMFDVVDNVYDNGVVGDGTLTQVTQHPGLSLADRVTQTKYDFRDRPVLSEAGVGAAPGTHPPITYTAYDNLDEPTDVRVYDGEGVTFSIVTISSLGSTYAGDLRARSETLYDERGRVYRTLTHAIAQPDGTASPSPSLGTDSGNLVTNTYYDRRGNVMAVFAPNGLVSKNVYDGAGRLIKQFATDGGAVNNSGSPVLTYAGASAVTNDVVLEQTYTQYDADSNPIFVTNFQRHHDYGTKSGATVTGLGALAYGLNGSGFTNTRISFVGNYYDEADRLITNVNWGNDGDDGAAFFASGGLRPSTIPSRSSSAIGFDPLLRTDYQYDVAGRQAIVTDPRNIETRTYYDSLGRTTTVTDAYTGSLSNMTPGSDPGPTSFDDENRQSFYEYNGADEVTTQTSKTYNPAAPSTPNSQTNTYTYGVTKSTSFALNSNTLLSQSSYGIVADPLGSPLPAKTGFSSDTQQVTGYDALGDITTQLSRDGTTHALSYDVLGRQTDDHVTSTATFSSGLMSTWADEKKVTYDALGRPIELTMLSSGTAKNDIYNVYDGLGNLIKQYQPHDDSAISALTGFLRSSIPVVQYNFDTNFSSNYSRQTLLTYPNGRVISYSYGFDTFPLNLTATSAAFQASLNSAISRIGYVADGATPSSANDLEDYDYLGLNTVVTSDRPHSKEFVRQSEVANNYYTTSGATGAKIASPPGTDPNGHSYPGIDDAGTQDPYDGLDRFGRVVDPGWSVSDRSIGYDADGNVLFTNLLATSDYERWKSEVYSYDNLNRQRSYDRGIMIGGILSAAYQSVSQTSVDIIAGVEAVNAAYLSQDTWGHDSSTGDFDQGTPTNPDSTLPLANVYQRPLTLPLATPPSATEYTLGGQNQQNERDMFVQFDAWGHLATQSEAYLFADTGTGNYYFANAYQNTYQFDALGRRVTETTTTRTGTVQTTDLYYDGSSVVQENQYFPGVTSPATHTQYVWSPVVGGQMILRDDDADNSSSTGNLGGTGSGLERRVWPSQGPDGSTWTVQQDYSTGGFKNEYLEEFIYNPSGQATSIRYNTGTLQYDFFTTSEFDFRYQWRGGRAGRDQATNQTNQPTNTASYIDQYNGTYLMPSGIVYDAATGTQAPMNTDKYAFYRTTAVNNGLNQYQYGTRSWTNVNGFNGTGSNIQNIDEQVQMLRLRTGLLGVSLGAGLVAGSALGVLGSGVALGIFTNFALGALPSFALSYGTGQPATQVFNQTLIGGAAGVVGAAAGRIVAAPLGSVGGVVGSTLRGAVGGGVAGAIYGGATGYASSGTLRGAIEGAEQLGAIGFFGGAFAGAGNTLFGAVRSSLLGPIIGCFPAGTPVMLVAAGDPPQVASVWSLRLQYWSIGSAISAAAFAGWCLANRKPARRRTQVEVSNEESEPPTMPLPAGHGGWASFFCNQRIVW